jgi:hypothetical protein
MLLFALATSACASRQKHPYPFPNPPRIPNSAREKHDAMKNVPPPEGLQADDDRWGVDQAQELERQNADRRAKAKAEGALVPMPSPSPEETSSETGTSTPRYIVK